MHASRVIVVFEQLQLSFQVVCSPKEQTIQILPADGPDEPFDKWMGPGNLGHRLHGFYSQDAQVGLPAVEPEQRIMIGTEPRGQALPGDGLVEHAAGAVEDGGKEGVLLGGGIGSEAFQWGRLGLQRVQLSHGPALVQPVRCYTGTKRNGFAMLRSPNSFRRIPSSAFFRLRMKSRTAGCSGLGMRNAKNGHNVRLRYSLRRSGKSTIGLISL